MTYPDIILTGNLTRDPECRWVNQGKPVTTLSVACNSRKQNQATGQYEDTEPLYVKCEAWEALAEDLANLRKGQRLHVHGRIIPNTWTDSKTQRKHYDWKVRIFQAWQPTTLGQPKQQTAQTGTPESGESWGEDAWDTTPETTSPPTNTDSLEPLTGLPYTDTPPF